MIFLDSLLNLVSGMMTGRDKASGLEVIAPVLDPAELWAAYRGLPLARKVVDIPADDACREWREWQAEAEQISDLEAEERRLGLRQKIRDGMKLARIDGGAVLYIGTKDSDPMKPLDPERMGRGGLSYVALLAASKVTAGATVLDPLRIEAGQPEHYTIGASVQVHPSRIVRLTGAPILDEDRCPTNLWGDSVLLGLLDTIKRLGGTEQNIASLVYEAKVDVVKIPDFMRNLSANGEEYANQITKRATLAATAKGINGMLLLDAEEEYQQKSASFATLPDILDRFMQAVAAEADIPMTRLFGMSPSGMNATGESDMRNYYDRIRAMQTLDLEPSMAVLDECLIRSALGERPPELHYNWRPLWQPSAKERAEIGDKHATSFERLARLGLLPEEALATTMVNVMTESGVMPGLESAVAEYYEGGGEGEGAAPDTDEGAIVSDAAPRTLYVHRKVLNADDILAWAKEQGFAETLPADDLHVTIAFSRTPLDWMKVGEAWSGEVTVNEGGARIVDRFGGARVLLFASSELSWRHEEIKRAGASWDHPEYQPHITISYSDKSPDLAEIEPYRGKIVLGPEVFQEVNEDWREGVSEVSE